METTPNETWGGGLPIICCFVSAKIWKYHGPGGGKLYHNYQPDHASRNVSISDEKRRASCTQKYSAIEFKMTNSFHSGKSVGQKNAIVTF